MVFIEGERHTASFHIAGCLPLTCLFMHLSTGVLEEGMDVYAEGAARPVGKILVAGDGSGRALALLRLQAAFSGKQLRARSKEGPMVSANRPSWWPPGWGREEEQQQP